MDLKPPYSLLYKKSQGNFWNEAFQVANNCRDEQGYRLGLNDLTGLVTFRRGENSYIKLLGNLPENGGLKLAFSFEPADWGKIKDDWYTFQRALEIECAVEISSQRTKSKLTKANDRCLTQAEIEFLNSVDPIKSLENKQIAEKLGVEEDTVRTHLQTLYSKFEINNPSKRKIIDLFDKAREEGYLIRR